MGLNVFRFALKSSIILMCIWSQGASHVEQLWLNRDEVATEPIGYVYKSGANLSDIVCALEAFMSSLPVKKDINIVLWPPWSDLKR